MKAVQTVAKIMTKQLITLDITDDLYKAESLFKKHKIHHIPVVKKNQIVGMLSWNDLLRISFADALNPEGKNDENEMYDLFDVEKIMTSRINTISSDVSLKEAARIFVKENFHALPVVDNDKLVGILTTTDLIKNAYNLK